jgi:hypothetical protein
MASPIRSASIAAPGFYGLNLQESAVSLSSGFALTAFNCVIDASGRIGARRGWTPVNTAVNTDLGAANPVEFMFEMTNNGADIIISAGNNHLFTGTTTMTTKTVRNADNSADATYTISGNNWQGAALPFGEGSDAQPHVYMVQSGHSPLVFHELPVSGGNPHDHDSGTFGFQKLGDVGTLPLGYSSVDFLPNCIVAAYGRIWMADIIGDPQTLYFSRLLDGSDFQGGDSGYLSLNAVFPNSDRIVAIAAHNGFLIIFGRNNIAIYSSPIDVTQLTLVDYIPNVGCVARDSVQNTGTDIVFLSDGGLRSLQRVIQEKSLPMRDISKNIRDDLMSNVTAEDPTQIKSAYYERDALYLLSLPTTGWTYCFDMRGPLPDGAARATIWNQINPMSFLVTNDKQLYIGKDGYIGKYFGYEDNGNLYRFQYFTNYFDFEAPIQEKLLKQIGFVVIGGSGQGVAVKWGFDYEENYYSFTKTLDTGTIYEYNDSTLPQLTEYSVAEFSGGIVLDKFKSQATGKGTVIQIGLEADIEGNPLSLQRIDVYIKQGKTI